MVTEKIQLLQKFEERKYQGLVNHHQFKEHCENKISKVMVMFSEIPMSGNPLQYSCLENPKDGGAQWATVHGVAKIWTRLGNFTFTFYVTGRLCWKSGLDIRKGEIQRILYHFFTRFPVFKSISSQEKSKTLKSMVETLGGQS